MTNSQAMDKAYR